MWKKKQHLKSWKEHGSFGLWRELLPSIAVHVMAEWQWASQSFHVSQTPGQESRSELFYSSWRQRMEKIGIVFLFPLPGLLRNGHSCYATSSLVGFQEESEMSVWRNHILLSCIKNPGLELCVDESIIFCLFLFCFFSTLSLSSADSYKYNMITLDAVGLQRNKIWLKLTWGFACPWYNWCTSCSGPGFCQACTTVWQVTLDDSCFKLKMHLISQVM